MKLTKVKPGEYLAENGMVVKKRGDAWFVITQDYRIVYKGSTLKGARIAAEHYTEKETTP